MLAAEKELKKLQKALDKAETNNKIIIEQQTNKLAKELSSKDQQISVLKGMLRSNSSEKGNDRNIPPIKRHANRGSYDESQDQSISISQNSSQGPLSTKEAESSNSQSSTARKFTQRSITNLSPSMIISKFIKMTSLYKNSQTPSGNKPNIAKLIANLKKKLQIFSSISSKELLENVPELKSAIDTDKTQLTLDEVINAITSAI